MFSGGVKRDQWHEMGLFLGPNYVLFKILRAIWGLFL